MKCEHCKGKGALLVEELVLNQDGEYEMEAFTVVCHCVLDDLEANP